MAAAARRARLEESWAWIESELDDYDAEPAANSPYQGKLTSNLPVAGDFLGLFELVLVHSSLSAQFFSLFSCSRFSLSRAHSGDDVAGAALRRRG